MFGLAVAHQNEKVWGLISHGDAEFFLCPRLAIRGEKTSVSISFLGSKNIFTITHILFAQDAINTT